MHGGVISFFVWRMCWVLPGGREGGMHRVVVFSAFFLNVQIHQIECNRQIVEIEDNNPLTLKS